MQEILSDHYMQGQWSASRLVYGLERLGEEVWNVLTDTNETNTVLQTFQWTRSWLKVFGDQNFGVAGVIPITVKRGLLGERVVRFVGDGRADYCDFIAARDKLRIIEAVLNVLFAEPKRWDVIELNNVPSESSTIELVQATADAQDSTL